MIVFDAEETPTNVRVSIKVIGVGGAGGNTINSMKDYTEKYPYDYGIEFIALNTDAQALALSKADRTMQLGLKSTKGLGTGANPDLGKRAAEEDIDKIMDIVQDADIVFLTGGMGGGTGSGALPVIARALKEKRKSLCVGVVTTPFLFEGKRRASVAQRALEELKKEVDTLLVIPNQKLLDVVETHISMIDAFGMINDVLHQSVKGIADIIAKPGHINVDFADVKAIMKDMGLAIMGTGKGSGPDRAQEAALQAITSPLLDNMSIKGAQGVLLNITGGTNLTLHEVRQAASLIYENADENANIIIGSVIDPTLDQEICITVIATGFFPAQQKEENAQADVVEKHVEKSSPVIVKKEESLPLQTVQEELANNIIETKNTLYDNDLDIPAFLRKKEHFKEDR